MVHGILQFTPSIAFSYVLHRCESRDIRCRESFCVFFHRGAAPTPAAAPANGATPGRLATAVEFTYSLARIAPGFVRRRRTGFIVDRDSPRGTDLLVGGTKYVFAGRSASGAGFDNDPSAGSPTETLLRLLLPLNDKVQWTSRDVAGGEPPTSPRSEHFTGPFNR